MSATTVSGSRSSLATARRRSQAARVSSRSTSRATTVSATDDTIALGSPDAGEPGQFQDEEGVAAGLVDDPADS